MSGVLNLSSDQINRKTSQSKERKVLLAPSDDEQTFAKVDHLKKASERKPPIPKEVLEIQDELFKLKDENKFLHNQNEDLRTHLDKKQAQLSALELYASEI